MNVYIKYSDLLFRIFRLQLTEGYNGYVHVGWRHSVIGGVRKNKLKL